MSLPAVRPHRRLAGAVLVLLMLVLAAAGCRGAVDPQAVPEPTASAGPTTSDTSTSEAPDAERLESPEPRSVTVALTGDVLVHTGVWQTGGTRCRRARETVPDFAPMFADLEPLVAPADLAIATSRHPCPDPVART